MLTLDDIRTHKTISTMVDYANACLEAIGYTDHGPRHVGYVSRVASELLRKLGYPARTVELAAIAGWVHDVGNLINRRQHGISGATLLFDILQQMGMDIEETCVICSAVGSHEEQSGRPISPVSAALIIADKVDAHKVRVRRGKYNAQDIHDRVNYSISKTNIDIDAKKRIIRFSFVMDEHSSVMEYMQIYITRMRLCEEAAAFLQCGFELVINDMPINKHVFNKM